MSPTTPMCMVESAHQMYREGNYGEALGFYTDALSIAKTTAQRIALHSNRAACYLKLHDFNKAAAECTSVLELDCEHTGALMLRAQTLVALKEYQCALFDVNRLLELNPESEVYTNLQSRLKTQLSLAPIPESEAEVEEEGVGEDENEVKPKMVIVLSKIGEEKRKGVDGLVVPSLKAVPDTSSSYDGSFVSEDRSKSISEGDPEGWVAIPKPTGHSRLDYSRWDRVDDSSEEEEEDEDEDEEETLPSYRFRVRTVGGQLVK
ncbi:hypothetical protein Dimus_011176 [Dionaea muscipula]